MKIELIEKENRVLTSAREIYVALGIKRKYANWINESIERAGLIEEQDFITIMLQSTGGRPSAEHLLTRDSALSITMMSGGQFAKKCRLELIKKYRQHETGQAFTTPQIEALMDLSKSMTLISIQKIVERKHFDLYNDKYSWYKYRANLLGYSTETLIEAMRAVNKKHQSIKSSLMQLDADELIRTAVIDFMLALGKTVEYATNVGNLCKSISQKSEYGNIIWDDTKPNPLGINHKEVSVRKELFNQSVPKLNQ